MTEPHDISGDAAIVANFAAAVLRALSEMAARSHRREADVAAALRGAKLPFDPSLLKGALQLLQAKGCVGKLVPLSDGGLLLTVKRQTLQPVDVPQRWLPFDGPAAATALPGGSGPPAGQVAEGATLDSREILDDAGAGAYRTSIDGRQIRASPALARLNGYASEAEMQRAVRDIDTEFYVDPSRRREFSRLMHEQGRVENFVSEVHRHRTRERIWITENGRLVRHPDSGEPLYYEGTIRELPEPWLDPSRPEQRAGGSTPPPANDRSLPARIGSSGGDSLGNTQAGATLELPVRAS